jgi:nicotinamidase-related amidase
MTSVVDIRAYLASGPAPTLVLVDLQQDYVAGHRSLPVGERELALANCRSALAHARRMGFPVAFVRSVGRTAGFSEQQTGRWIESFEPRGSEMVFERDKPSCFSNPLFADVMGNCGGPIVLAGFAGATGCLATAVDAYHRGCDLIYLNDASASHAINGRSDGETHAMLTEVIRLYAAVADTQGWVRSTSARQFSFAGG